MKRIRMLVTLATGRGLFEAGKSYNVGMNSGEVHPDNAQKWLNAKVAEEDKAVDGPPEKKEKKLKKK